GRMKSLTSRSSNASMKISMVGGLDVEENARSVTSSGSKLRVTHQAKALIVLYGQRFRLVNFCARRVGAGGDVATGHYQTSRPTGAPDSISACRFFRDTLASICLSDCLLF